jgi:type I restriction enzyme, S subunit
MTLDGWRTATLAKVVQPEGLQTGPFGSQLKASEYTATGVPVLMPKNLRGGRVDPAGVAHIPASIASDRLARHRVSTGDILFGRRGDIGRCALVTYVEDGWLCGTGCLRARPSSEIDSRFLIQQLSSASVSAWLSDRAVGRMPRLSTEILAKLPVRLPPLPEQRKIAAILSSVDVVIEKTQAVIEQLALVSKAMLQKLMTCGLPGRHTRFKKTEIGEMPQEWEVLPAHQVCEAVTDCKNRTPPFCEQGFPVVRTCNIRNGRLILEDLRCTDAASYREWTSRGEPLAGDILITREAPIGEVCLVPAGMQPCLGQRVMLYRPNRSRVSSQFMLFALQSAGIQERLRVLAGGSSVGHVRVGDIRKLVIPVPPLAEQATIAAVLSTIDQRRQVETSELEHLRHVKHVLMSALLSGELRVTPEEIS